MRSRLLSLAAVGLAALLGTAGPAAAQDADIRDLARRIAKERDRVDPTVFDELARRANEEALAALEDSLGRLKKPAPRAALLAALAHFAAAPELHARCFALLTPAALEGPEEPARAATRALLGFGEPALAELERVLAESDDAAARSTACDPLVPLLRRRSGSEPLALLLANATLRHDKGLAYLGLSERERRTYADWTHREVVRRAVAADDSAERRELLAAKLLDPEASRAWKLLLIEVLAGLTGAGIDRALDAALGERDAAVVLAAMDRIGERDRGWEELEPVLRPLVRHRDPSIRRAAVAHLGRFGVTAAEWRSELLALARSRDRALRMGAASALADLRTPEAMEALHALLEDDEWSVRVEALHQAARLRFKASVPVLIERMERESGRFQDDAYAALRILTGLDHGRLPERWTRWWEREQATFELPPYDDAVRAEQERRARASSGDTRSAQYFGAQVKSERVVFVLDVSGSMRLPSGGAPADAGAAELTQDTRMDVAKRELMAVVRAMPDDTLFNIIFFESEVTWLEKKLVRMRKSVRQKALRFVSEKYAIGSTALYPALELAFADPVVDTIYLLSDGAPTEGELTDIAEIRAEVRRWNSARHVRVHGISMGEDSTLLRWLTADTGGRYIHVP
ncbi:MAG: HEAT repeat domain-containing protein [Planctomycetota bacterium]